MAQKLPFLKVNKTRIVDEYGKPVVLKGIAIGGWLMMEGYMMCGRNITEREFKLNLEKAQGKPAADDFAATWRENFFRESDIETIKGWGANCVRIPFNYRVVEFEDRPYSLNEAGFKFLDKVVEWCERNSIYCILDMHAAPGAQNPDWHSDPVGEPQLFTNEVNKDRFLRLWHFLAERYNGVSAIAGYDVLNEPVVPFTQESMLKDLYTKATKEIRDADKDHIIFLEGNFWGQRLKCLGKPDDNNTAYSAHAYPIADYTFNWVTDLEYPGKVYGIKWDKEKLEFLAKQYWSFVQKMEVPLYIGEMGVNWRGDNYGELKWVKDLLDMFEKHDIHWTYWTYKTIANSVFPDGIYRYVDNPAWINRKGPVTGWENFYTMWPSQKGKIMNSWRTENFVCNDKLLSLLKKYW